MRLYTVGPVEMRPETLEVAGRQVPYFRNQEFSQVMLECERLFTRALKCPVDGGYRLVTLTSSSTGAMEAAIMNCLGPDDRAIVVDGGTFGHRFAEMCSLHGVAHDRLEVPVERDLTREMLDSLVMPQHTALLVNLHETSIGKLYDLDMVSAFCKEHGLFLIVDAVSAFLCDPIDMAQAGIGVLITGSQKALSLQPGLSFCVLSPEGIERACARQCRSMYFDFQDYLQNGERGQTPFTPAVGIVYELQEMLQWVDGQGVDAVVERTAALAEDFRTRLAESGLPLALPPYTLSNALTPVVFGNGGAQECARRLAEEFGYIVNPCGGDNADVMFRVAHMGNHSVQTNTDLVDALKATVR